MTPSLRGLGVHERFTDVGLASVATTLVGVVGDSGPVSSPQATTLAAASRAIYENSDFRIPILFIIVARILVVPLDDDAPVLLPAYRGGIRRDRRILPRTAHPDAVRGNTLADEILPDRARPIEADHDVRGIRPDIVGMSLDADLDGLAGIRGEVHHQTVDERLSLVAPGGTREVHLRSVERQKDRADTSWER